MATESERTLIKACELTVDGYTHMRLNMLTKDGHPRPLWEVQYISDDGRPMMAFMSTERKPAEGVFQKRYDEFGKGKVEVRKEGLNKDV